MPLPLLISTEAQEVTIAQLPDDPYPVLARVRQQHPVAWVPVLNGWLEATTALLARFAKLTLAEVEPIRGLVLRKRGAVGLSWGVENA